MIDHVSVPVSDLDAADVGRPAIRQGARAPYFGAFVFDPDANRIEALTFPRAGAA